ncbi:hypothetical protein HRUBRA_00542 [Pseudohaliea rubra DSM 19751]|uniref:Uncharacterized protein n=1 Tax=Pseudohaliea rubra DSM 19751 TaxID=1265313 RepID=A0A095VU18_9GAMM|nr:hypothetical protein HRUBRA_00542 [Pseudohaliea rubra DSM 19751]
MNFLQTAGSGLLCCQYQRRVRRRQGPAGTGRLRVYSAA